MNTPLSIALALLIPAAPALASDNGILSEIRRFTDLFDGSRPNTVEVSPPPSMPMPNFPHGAREGDWGVPQIQGVPVESSTKQADVLKEMQSCAAVDYVYFRQPSAAEVVTTLEDCMSALSKRYQVEIKIAQGKKGILILISGLIPPGSMVHGDLETALQLRGGMLFGHPVSLINLERPASDSRTSSLQPIVDQCRIETPRLQNAAAFVSVFADCVRGAKGIAITSIRPDAKDEALVLVYSRDARHLIHEMNGVVRILTDHGVTRLRIQAQSELLTDTMIDSGLSLPAARPL